MSKQRMEAFSDAVIAIAITVMVLGLNPPSGADIAALFPVIPVFFSYVLSYIYLGIYWNNHHHLLHAVKSVNGRVLWANLHLLFWLSLIPFTTAWMGENHFAPEPVALYGVVLLLAAIAYYILTRSLIALHGRDSTLAGAVGRDRKGKISILIYAVAVPLSLLSAWSAFALYAAVALIWFIPDRRIEKRVAE